MNWRLLTIIAASISLFGGESIAAPPLTLSINCVKATTTVEINECTSREAKSADRQLNQYQQLRPKISSKQR